MTAGPSFHRRRETTSRKTRPSSPSNSRTAASPGETRSTKPALSERNCTVNRGTGWAHFGHTRCPQRSILMNHNECHFAAQCRFGSETSTPKWVRFPAAPLRPHLMVVTRTAGGWNSISRSAISPRPSAELRRCATPRAMRGRHRRILAVSRAAGGISRRSLLWARQLPAHARSFAVV
jgi:hypothetical protein